MKKIYWGWKTREESVYCLREIADIKGRRIGDIANIAIEEYIERNKALCEGSLIFKQAYERFENEKKTI